MKVNQKARIELNKQFKVPVTGLNGLIPIAEEIEKEKKKKVRSEATAFEEDSQTEEEDDDEIVQENPEDKELNPRKLAKKAVKAERREKRKQKKELKMAFKTQIGKYNQQQTVKTAGEVRPGVSVRKIE